MSLRENSIAPVVQTVVVNTDCERAFQVFCTQIGRWWPAGHRLGEKPFTDVIIEPKPGGRFYEKGEDGSECEWGHVKTFAPAERLLLAWQLNADWTYDPDFEVEVEITFTPVGDKTEVRLEHRNLERYGANAPAVSATLAGEGGWPGILANYSELVRGIKKA